MPRYLLNPRHQPSEGGVVQTKSDRLSEASKAAVFSVMLLVLALAAALLIRALDPPQMLAYIIWGSTPLVAVLIMTFVITGDGRTREGRALLGLHRLGVRLWWIATLGSFLISLLAAALTWATPFASYTTPASPIDTVLNFAVNASVTIVTFAAAEEIAWRGYLLPRLLQLGAEQSASDHGSGARRVASTADPAHFALSLRRQPVDHSAVVRRHDRRCRIRLRRPSDRNRKHLAGFDRARRAQRLVGCPGSADCHEFTGAGQRVSRGRHRFVNSAGHRRGRVLAAQVASATSAQGVVKSMKSVGQQWEPS